MPDVSLDDSDKDLVLELLARLRNGGQASAAAARPPLATASAKPKDKAAAAEWKAQRVAEALVEDKAKRKKEKAKQALLAEEFKADAAASVTARQQQQAVELPASGSVRVTLCNIDKPSDRKLVVLQRAPDICELLKVGKAKLRMKKALGARLLDGGTAVKTTAELVDGCVVAVCVEAMPEQAAVPAATAAAAEEETLPSAPPATPLDVSDPPDAVSKPDPSGAEQQEEQQEQQQQQQQQQQEQQQEQQEQQEQHEPSAKERKPPKAHKGQQRSKERPRSDGRGRVLLPQRVSSSSEAELMQARLSALSPPPAMLSVREALPVASQRAALLEAVRCNPVTIVQGEPGCGKSTQLPQFLVEEMVSRGLGGEAAIIVTQPRRVSAISLALRVAEERGESVGDVVG